ncbi:MAG: type III-B CRISPR module-associated protein Cmr3 [Actinobacteria bacterium]|jgi:CRISPR-associated protein Cmr3|nr:type III-B CRISPR module-associated protein Cmr3 [Actinomycetota bacterium]
MTDRWFFVEPLDILAFRGNRMFGDEGAFGETSIIPPPSVFAGAFRSLLFSLLSPDQQRDFQAGKKPQCSVGEQLGSPESPGTFRLRWLTLGRIQRDGGNNGKIELLVATPSDVALAKERDEQVEVAKVASLISPSPEVATSSAVTEQLSTLVTSRRTKTSSGFISGQGYQDYLNGSATVDTVASNDIYSYDTRVGIGLDLDTRTAQESMLYSARFLRLHSCGGYSTGYVVGIAGAEALPNQGFLRLGGDGKAVSYKEVTYNRPTGDYDQMVKSRCFKIVLLTPGIFTHGWLPALFEQDGDGRWHLSFNGLEAELISLSFPRPDTASGWDMHARRPKPAVRTVVAGSVYYLKLRKGDKDSLRELDEYLVKNTLVDHETEPIRNIEGFGIAQLGAVVGKLQDHWHED